MNKRPGKGIAFAKRMYLPRAVGTSLGTLCVAIGILPLAPAGWTWALLLVHGLVLPHLAYQYARRAAEPWRAEQHNLVFDGFSGGFWAGAMGLNPLPSVIILSMIAMDKAAVGGLRLLGRTVAAQCAGIVLGLLAMSPPLFPSTTEQQMLACLPILLIYPAAVALVCYRLTMQLIEHKRTLARLSQTDSLTGLINHGAWKDLLHREFPHCRDTHGPHCLALIDVDRFKPINDTYGHLAGDEVLKTVAAALKTHLRKTDKLARYGGDEFCVLLPDTTVQQAREVLERLREAVEQHRDPAMPALALSLSIGVAPCGPHLADANAWLYAADMALYQAKSAGRNRIDVALAVAP